MLQLKKKVRSQSVVLIFVGSSVTDSRKKGFGGQAAIFEYLTQHTIDKVAVSGIPYRVHTANEQQGATFGARLQYAMQSLFKQGYDQVIAIGNDSPQLSTQHLCKTLELLEQGHTVLGPSLDGGFYLLGIHRDGFNQLQSTSPSAKNSFQQHSLFEQLPWCHTNLFKDFHSLLSAFGASVQTLGTLADLDNLSDARNLLRVPGINRELKSLLLLLLSPKLVFSNPTPIAPKIHGLGQYATRGSPSRILEN